MVRLIRNFSVLGLEQNNKSCIKFFADDPMLYSIILNERISAADLNHDLGIIQIGNINGKWLLTPTRINKQVELIFSQRKIEVKKGNSHKHLGLTLDPKLTFDGRINEKISKARKGIGIIRYLSSFTPVKTFNEIYKLFVRPHYDYCDVVYHVLTVDNPSDFTESLSSSMDRIERVQYQAARAITGCWQGSNRNKLYDELGWESLSDRKMVQKANTLL